MQRRAFIKHISAVAGSLALNNFNSVSFSSASECKYEQSKAKKHPNIVWIMMDDCRADAIGCYGRPWAKTPHFDALAENGVCFTTAIVQNPVCIPSRRSMKTGCYSHQAGPMAMGEKTKTPGSYENYKSYEQFDSKPNLLDAWTQAGSQPVNVGKIHAFKNSWLSKSDTPRPLTIHGQPTVYLRKIFEQNPQCKIVSSVTTKTHNWQIGGLLSIPPELTDTQLLGDLAVNEIENLADQPRPFFLRVSFHAPHVPCYIPPEYFIDPEKIKLPLPSEKELKSKPRFEKNALRQYAGGLDLTPDQIALCRGTYYGMVSLIDHQVGRIVEKLKQKGLLENTIIAVNSDQGFQLGEHGLWKKRVFYEANVKSPLIISCPSLLPKNKIIDTPVEMIDFLPTLMKLSNLPVPSDIPGKSLLPLINGKTTQWRTACFSEIDHSYSMYPELRINSGRRIMVRTEEFKLICFMDNRVTDKDGALYDLRNDPNETQNLYDISKYKPIVSKLEKMICQWDKGDFF